MVGTFKTKKKILIFKKGNLLSFKHWHKHTTIYKHPELHEAGRLLFSSLWCWQLTQDHTAYYWWKRAYCSGLIYRQETMLSKTSTISLYSFPKLIPLSKYHRQLECESGSLGWKGKLWWTAMTSASCLNHRPFQGQSPKDAVPPPWLQGTSCSLVPAPTYSCLVAVCPAFQTLRRRSAWEVSLQRLWRPPAQWDSYPLFPGPLPSAPLVLTSPVTPYHQPP